MQKDNFSQKLDKFTQSGLFYTICIVVVVFVLAEFISNGLNYLDNH